MLNTEAIDEFKNLYLKQYGIRLTHEQAIELGTKLIRLVKVVYGQHLPRKWVSKFDRKENKN